MRTLTRQSLPAALAAALFVTTGASAAELFIELRTDFLPGVEFTLVRTAGTHAETGDTFDAEVAVSTATDALAGVRIFEGDIFSGPWRLVTDLIDPAGNILASRRVDFDIRDQFGFTVFITRDPSPPPMGGALKSAALQVDNNGDGLISAGDIVRYTVDITGPDAVSFSDRLGLGQELIAGSVFTFQGLVIVGNAPGDTFVGVIFLGPQANATIRYDVLVSAAVSNQGVLRVDNGFSDALVLTDDPSTQEGPDATVVQLNDGGTAQCLEELAEVEALLLESTAENADLTSQLDALLGDSDGDGVIAAADDCPFTSNGEAVDKDGCSRTEFCGQISGTTWRDRLMCSALDWKHDEPLRFWPRDCRPTRSGCRPR